MALQGNLCDFSVTEILQLLGAQRKTGCLMLEWNTERALVYVLDGKIVSSRSPGMGSDDPLLKFLIKVHRLSDEQRRGLQTIHKESGRDLEDLLINGRYLDAEELRLFLERQILNDLMRLVRWENGSYRFDPKLQWATPLARLGMEGALIEASRRVDEQKRFVTAFKDPHQLLGVRDLPDPDEPLMEEEKELFGIIDGHHTVVEVVEAASLSEYEAYEALHRLLEAHWIEVVGRRDPGAAPAPQAARPVAPPLPRHRRPVAAQILVGSLILLGTVGLEIGARAVRPSPPAVATDDVFVVAQLREVRMALDLYRRENGVYPRTLQALVDDEWIGAEEIRLPGYDLVYSPERDGQAYRLDLRPGR